MMYVIGALDLNNFLKVRKIIPHHFLLVLVLGYRGNLEDVKYGMNKDCGLLVNSSRG